MFSNKWEPWSDVMVFYFAGESVLLQGRKHKKTYATEFRIVHPRKSCYAPHNLTKEHMENAGLWRTINGGNHDR